MQRRLTQRKRKKRNRERHPGPQVKLLLGLGNPGHTFHGTRHNVGFAVIQRLAEQGRVGLDHRLVGLDGRPAVVYGELVHEGQTVRLAMPLTMMNESGEALRVLEAGLDDLLIICDDVNLPLGAIRLRADGGPGGHHGLQSCLDVLGTERVGRLRIGVGAKDMPQHLEHFVLSRFGADERPAMTHAIEQAVEACLTWVKEGVAVAMNRYNRSQDPA